MATQLPISSPSPTTASVPSFTDPTIRLLLNTLARRNQPQHPDGFTYHPTIWKNLSPNTRDKLSRVRADALSQLTSNSPTVAVTQDICPPKTPPDQLTLPSRNPPCQTLRKMICSLMPSLLPSTRKLPCIRQTVSRTIPELSRSLLPHPFAIVSSQGLHKILISASPTMEPTPALLGMVGMWIPTPPAPPT